MHILYNILAYVYTIIIICIIYDDYACIQITCILNLGIIIA